MRNDSMMRKRVIIAVFTVLVAAIAAVAVVSALTGNSVYAPAGGAQVSEQTSVYAAEAERNNEASSQSTESGAAAPDEKNAYLSSDDESEKTGNEGAAGADGDTGSGESDSTDAIKAGSEEGNGESGTDTDGRAAASGAPDVDSIAAPYISRLQALEGHYTAVVNNAAEAAKREFLALPPEQQTEEKKNAIISSKSGRLSQEEAQCDSQVSIILYELNADLVRSGLDTSIVGELRQRYYDEKASYVSQF